MKVRILIVLAVIISATLYSGCHTLYTETKNLYNTSVNYELDLQREVENQVSTYDAYYLKYVDKYNVADINKETFLTVTQIIMSNRKDGENLAWKWVTENTHIPYQEFTKFYSDLSSFITERYDEILAIERRKQSIVNEHNKMLKTFPNNLYNKWLIGTFSGEKRNDLVYQFGFVTEETKKLFNLNK